MLAENLQTWREQLLREGRVERGRETAQNLITLTEMDDSLIAKATGLSVEDVSKLRAAVRH